MGSVCFWHLLIMVLVVVICVEYLYKKKQKKIEKQRLSRLVYSSILFSLWLWVYLKLPLALSLSLSLSVYGVYSYRKSFYDFQHT